MWPLKTLFLLTLVVTALRGLVFSLFCWHYYLTLKIYLWQIGKNTGFTFPQWHIHFHPTLSNKYRNEHGATLAHSAIHTVQNTVLTTVFTSQDENYCKHKFFWLERHQSLQLILYHSASNKQANFNNQWFLLGAHVCNIHYIQPLTFKLHAQWV